MICISSVVLQGLVRVHELYNTFINDLKENIKSLLRKFSNDTKMGRVVNN